MPEADWPRRTEGERQNGAGNRALSEEAKEGPEASGVSLSLFNHLIPEFTLKYYFAKKQS